MKPTNNDVNFQLTAAEQTKLNYAIATGWVDSTTDACRLGLQLILSGSGLFNNIARDRTARYQYTPQTRAQYENLQRIYQLGTEFYDALTRATDDVDDFTNKAPNEWKDSLRDWLLPEILQAMNNYETKHDLKLTED